MADNNNNNYDDDLGELDEADREFLFDTTDPEQERREREAMDDWAFVMGAIRENAVIRMGSPDRSPYMLGRYEALETVDGGMGMVVLGRDPVLDRKVAIKLWKATGPAAEAALLAEAKTLAKLSHPNVVHVFDVGKYRSSVYFVMESVDGVNGHDWILAGKGGWQAVRDVFVGAGSGLAAAHDAKIHHRDFKPANMLVGVGGRVLVLDFGIAASLGTTDGASEREAAAEPATPGAGTVTYMAPERIRGRRGDARSDQFSFCVTMWKALHRVRPYPGETGVELLEAIASGELRTGPWADEVPGWLNRVVRKGLAEDPDLRHRNMHELVRALRDGPLGAASVDGASGDVGLSGATGRLLNAPGTGGPGDEFDALADEIVRRLQAPSNEGRSVEFAGARAAPRLPWVLLVASTVASVGVLAMVMLRPWAPAELEAPRVVIVEEDPLNVILGHIAADNFGVASVLWHEKRRGSPADEYSQRLSYGDSLLIGLASFERARELVSTNPQQAAAAAHIARDVAAFLSADASDEATKRAGNQLREEVVEFVRSRLPANEDATIR